MAKPRQPRVLSSPSTKAGPRQPALRLTPHEVRIIAIAAFCDPRTVRKALAGEATKPLSFARVQAALRKLKRRDLLAALPTGRKPTRKAA